MGIDNVNSEILYIIDSLSSFVASEIDSELPDFIDLSNSTYEGNEELLESLNNIYTNNYLEEVRSPNG